MEKELIEKRNSLVEEIETMLDSAKAETRALNNEEIERAEQVKIEVANINATIKVEGEMRNMENKVEVVVNEVRALEEASFLNFIQGDKRALDVSTNGGIVPVTIADRIIETVKEICPIYQMATIYNVAGTLSLPVYDESTTSIGAAYSEDFTELTEGTGKFNTVDLKGFVIGVLAKISKSLINKPGFDLVAFVIKKVAEAIARFIEKECLIGTDGKMTGIFSSANIVTTASATAITVDELIDLQDSIPDVLQTNACFIMNRATRKSIRKLKDLEGAYLLNKDITSAFGYTLLGKPVYVSENAAVIGAGNKVIAYGDMSALSIKLAQEVEIQVLVEKYATSHAVGVVGYIELDSKITEVQKLAVLQMKA